MLATLMSIRAQDNPAWLLHSVNFYNILMNHVIIIIIVMSPQIYQAAAHHQDWILSPQSTDVEILCLVDQI